MIITTTPTVEGHPIEEYLGVVTGEAILGAHIGRDIMASFTDIIGGRSAEYEEEVRKARTIALEEMAAEGERKGGMPSWEWISITRSFAKACSWSRSAGQQ